MGCAMSQGVLPLFPNSMSKSWSRFQDLRNDYSKRDFITYGAASGIAAAFRAPIGMFVVVCWNLSDTLVEFFGSFVVDSFWDCVVILDMMRA